MCLGIVLSLDYLPKKQAEGILPVLENVGFTHVFVPEIWGRDAFTQVAYLASLNNNLAFGTGIVNIFSRSPSTIAQTAASLAELTEGRFILGLGLSGPIVIQNWHGIDYFAQPPLQRTREYFEIVRMILNGDRLNYKGQIFQLKNFKLSFKVNYSVPLFLASLGPKNVQLAGEIADGWFPIWVPFNRMETLFKDLNKGQEIRSKELNSKIEIAPFLITCASNKPKDINLVKAHLAYYVGGMGTFYNNLMKRLGYIREAERIQKAWKAGDRKTAANEVTDEMMNSIAVTGNAETCRRRYALLKEKGISLPVLMLPFRCPPQLAYETIKAFSE
ncbi:MAG: LLM class flavin-dependent oxidoreductase [Candidatus Hodarchaeota archaeon]